MLNPFPFSVSILIALFAITWTWITMGNLHPIGLKKFKNKGKTLIQTFLLFISLMLIMEYLIDPAINFITNNKPDLSTFEFIKGNTLAWLQYLGVSWFIAALCEEIVFRGFLLNVLHRLSGESNWGQWVAILISSTLFGVVHFYQGLSGILLTGIIGFALAVIYFKMNRNLWVCIILHGLIDTTSLTLLYLGIN
jgi:membrane protease YdiL (CAAX protease family)